MALQGKVVNWAAWHLKHHATSDHEGDPHSPLEGFFHAHVGWILKATPAERERYRKRLLSDPVVTFVDRTNYQALLAKPDNGVSGLPVTREDWYTHAAV
jgi:stearoyl-CoA desaturase (Delta-9 desaturase)